MLLLLLGDRSENVWIYDKWIRVLLLDFRFFLLPIYHFFSHSLKTDLSGFFFCLFFPSPAAMTVFHNALQTRIPHSSQPHTPWELELHFCCSSLMWYLFEKLNPSKMTCHEHLGNLYSSTKILHPCLKIWSLPILSLLSKSFKIFLHFAKFLHHFTVSVY